MSVLKYKLFLMQFQLKNSMETLELFLNLNGNKKLIK